MVAKTDTTLPVPKIHPEKARYLQAVLQHKKTSVESREKDTGRGLEWNQNPETDASCRKKPNEAGDKHKEATLQR